MAANQQFPLVSIVMATFNGALYLEEQLNTVFGQTYPNIEVIAVDDSSTDNTVAILQTFADKHPNFKYTVNEQRLGYIKNFEKACQLATGDYLSFCDQDDVWELNKTRLLMDSIGDSPMIYCDDELVDGNLKSLNKKHSDLKNLSSFTNCLYFATDNCVGGHALIMKKELLKATIPFPQEMPYDLWCAFIATFHGGIKYYNAPLVKWRQHASNVTTSASNKAQKQEETRQRLRLFYEACPVELKLEKEVLGRLVTSYQDYSFKNNLLRMNTFFKYQPYLLGMKKKTSFRKFLFCLKMFYKIRLHVA